MSSNIQTVKSQKLPYSRDDLNSYEWHDNRNKQRAMEVLEGYAHAHYNDIPRLGEQYKNEALAVLSKDKAEKAVSVALALDLPAKLFAVHQGPFDKPVAIKGSKFDWNVLPIETSSEPVPTFAVRNLSILRQNGIVFDSFAVAVPLKANYLPSSLALKTEAQKTAKQLGRLSKTALITALELSSKTAKAGARLARRAAAPAGKAAGAAALVLSAFALGFIKDPVFLGCFGDNPVYMVEVARWE